MKRIVRTIVLSLFVCGLLIVQTEPTGATSDPQQGQPPPISPMLRQELIFKDSGAVQPSTPETEATETVPWSKLVFQSYRDNNWEIYRANADGTGQVRVTNNGALDKDARLNRGATRVVFASTRSGGDSDLYLMNPDGGAVTTLYQNADRWEQYPNWSPDSNKIAFESYDYNNNKAYIYVVNANGSGLQRLTNSGSYDGMPFWSPDGAKIAFSSGRSGQYRIWVMNADGTGVKMLSNQRNGFDPTWSRDGSQIAYDADADGDGHEELWLMNADGSNQRMVFNPPQASDSAWTHSWSADGRYIAFTRITLDSQYWYAAYIDALDTTVPNRVIRLSTDNRAWKPDWQTTDVAAPASSVQSLPIYSTGAVTVAWSGSDTGGAGVKNYDVQVRDGASGAWTDWRAATTGTSAQFSGVDGHTYAFRSRARDNAFNVEAWPASPDATTTVDTRPPQTRVSGLPAESPGPFTVLWTGTDPGSGLASYDVQVKDGASGTWTNWKMGTSSSSASYPGTGGHTYAFRSRGHDAVGNVEAWPSAADATTTVEALPPQSQMRTLPVYARQGVTLAWSGGDHGGSRVANYDVQYRVGAGGTWTNFLMGTSNTSAPFNGQLGQTHYFRVRARDTAQNVQPWPAGDGNTETTLYSWAIAGKASDNRGAPLAGIAVATTPGALQSSVSDDSGAYAAYVAPNAATYSVDWSKGGYGDLPVTSFPPASDAQVDIVLPPADNAIVNGGFETGIFGPAWTAAGTTTPSIVTALRHTGGYAAVLGSSQAEGSAAAPEAGDSTLAQTVAVGGAMQAPTLSFFYQTNGLTPANGNRFEVEVVAGSGTSTLLTVQDSTAAWTPAWIDLSPWAGQTITLRFKVLQAGASSALAHVDDVTAGSAYPDLWVSQPRSAALPGEQVELLLVYGNRGGVSASNVRITEQLPTGLTFLSADPPPAATSPALRWDQSVLASNSGPSLIRITVRVDPTAALGNTLLSQVNIVSDTGELELANNSATSSTYIGRQSHLPLIVK